MEQMMTGNNLVRLCGSLGGSPVFSHSSRGICFYRLPLEVRRLSGSVDRLNVLLRSEQLEALELADASRLLVQGELRSYNNHRGEGAKLVLSVLAREIGFADEPDDNLVLLRGTLCRPPRLRRTPLGREICDLMLAVNRPGGRSDYLPCICWGQTARRASLWSVGDRIGLEGRFQSRDYVKLTEEGPIHKTAFEVSVSTAEPWVAP